VNCIEIEPIKATEEFGKTSDGTPKRIYAATFDIDMGKCCFCGLCTTVCPTECLTMTKVYDFSVTDIGEHNFAFAEMSEADILEKRTKLEEHQKAKAISQAAAPTVVAKTENTGAPAAPRPVFKPKIKPPGSPLPPPST
jgi:formate hydrogenlyase subunit 6/NADH:ubiquinone oxidoreductase subunit I